MCSTGANVSVMVLQGCKSTPQKTRPIESDHGRHAVQVANVCSYKLGQKMNFIFGWFLHGQSHIMTYNQIIDMFINTMPAIHTNSAMYLSFDTNISHGVGKCFTKF